MYICIHRGPQVQKGGDKRRPSHLKYIVVWMDDKEGIVLFVLALRALQSPEEKQMIEKMEERQLAIRLPNYLTKRGRIIKQIP